MAIRIGRRQFMSALGGATVLRPLAARAQQPALPVVGYLNGRSADSDAPYGSAFHQGLAEAGFVEGRNVKIEYRWAEFQYDRLTTLAADLVRHQPKVIVASPIQAALPAKAATATIPVVFAIGSDPVEFGLVASLNRPGGNVTGITWLGGPTLSAKRFELLHELVPTAMVIALLINPTNESAKAETRELEKAAGSLGLQLYLRYASTEIDISEAFESFAHQHVGALLVGTDALFLSRREEIAAMAARHAIPTMSFAREFAAVGGLISYGTSFASAYRQAGVYAGRILKGDNPANLPVQQSTRVELIINLRTAKALDLVVSLPLLGRADEVIE
jgi:putative tryptophan/tyrosine transport system substrate-binding protein